MERDRISDQDNIARVWDIIEEIGVCMLTAQFCGGLRARPLVACPTAGPTFYVTDINSAKEDEIGAAPYVELIFVDVNDNTYMSITARAFIMRDAERRRPSGESPARCGGRAARAIPAYPYCGSNLPLQNCGMDQRALPYCLRNSQSKADSKEAGSRRELRGDRQDVSRQSLLFRWAALAA
jgi:hypothetical protein